MPRPGRAPELDRDADKTRSSLINLFPETDSITAGFNIIPIPAGFTVPAGQSAWFNLIDFVPSDVLGQEVYVFGMDVEYLSTNNNDGGALVDAYGVALANQAAWGDHFGTKAAIVLGQHLPLSPTSQTWSTGACQLPTLNDTITDDVVRYWQVRTFPPGSMRDAIAFKEKLWKPISPHVKRVGFGEHIQVGLVIDGAQAQAGANKSIVGFAMVQVSIGLTRNPSSFDQR